MAADGRAPHPMTKSQRRSHLESRPEQAPVASGAFVRSRIASPCCSVAAPHLNTARSALRSTGAAHGPGLKEPVTYSPSLTAFVSLGLGGGSTTAASVRGSGGRG